MKTVYIAYTILRELEVEDNCTQEDAEEFARAYAKDLGIDWCVNDMEVEVVSE